MGPVHARVDGGALASGDGQHRAFVDMRESDRQRPRLTILMKNGPWYTIPHELGLDDRVELLNADFVLRHELVKKSKMVAPAPDIRPARRPFALGYGSPINVLGPASGLPVSRLACGDDAAGFKVEQEADRPTHGEHTEGVCRPLQAERRPFPGSAHGRAGPFRLHARRWSGFFRIDLRPGRSGFKRQAMCCPRSH